jgi:predicted phage-related endonuclease
MSETLEDILNDTTTLTVRNRPVVLDSKRLRFNEANISRFLEEEASWYDYFGRRLAEAEHDLQQEEIAYDTSYSDLFGKYKDAGGSDKRAEADAKADKTLIVHRHRVLEAKQNVKFLQQHLRAWDKAHENAQNRGNTLRKELDKLNSDIRSSEYGSTTNTGGEGVEDILEEYNRKIGRA